MGLRIVLFAIALCFFLGCKERKKEGVVAQEIPVIEKKTEADPLYTDLEGNAVSLDDFKGKRIILNYWATWCRPCIEEMPALLRLQQLLKGENYVLLLASDQSLATIKKFKEKRGWDFHYIKLNGTLMEIGINALPTSFIYNEQGEEVKKIVGAIVWDAPETVRELKAIH